MFMQMQCKPSREISPGLELLSAQPRRPATVNNNTSPSGRIAPSNAHNIR